MIEKLEDFPFKVGTLFYFGDNKGIVELMRIDTENRKKYKKISNGFFKKPTFVEDGHDVIIKKVWVTPLHDISNMMYSFRWYFYDQSELVQMKNKAHLLMEQTKIYINRKK